MTAAAAGAAASTNSLRKFHSLVDNAYPVAEHDLNLARFTLAKFMVNFAHVRLLTTEAQYAEVQAGFTQLDLMMTAYQKSVKSAAPGVTMLIKFNEQRSAELFTKLFNKLKWENKEMKARVSDEYAAAMDAQEKK